MKLPKINPEDFQSEKNTRKIASYLSQLEENLRYQFANLDESNMNEQFIKDLTVGNLLITNGDNSIIANGEVGLQMLKGSKKQFAFNIETGEATFGGRIVGGSIESDNYIFGVSGMKIDLTNGTIDSKGLRILENGDAEFSGEIRGATMISWWPSETAPNRLKIEFDKLAFRITNFQYNSDMIESSMILGSDVITFHNSDHRDAEYGAYGILIEDAGGTLFKLDYYDFNYKDYQVIHAGNINQYVSGATGSFVAGTKTVTVSNGIIKTII